MKHLFKVSDFSSMYCDGLAIKDNNLLFGSFWAKDTTVLEALAKFTLPVSQGGISDFKIGSIRVVVNTDRLKKQTSRVVSQVFGKLVHLWLYDESLLTIDVANSRSLSLVNPVASVNDLPKGVLWSKINKVSQFPLLDEWQELVTNFCLENDFIALHDGLNMKCLEIELDNEKFADFLTANIRRGLLTAEVNNV